jgi:hypothetical protein
MDYKVVIQENIGVRDGLSQLSTIVFGALRECFKHFPLFRDDYVHLANKNIIRPVSTEQCEWMKSKTSLAEYFSWIRGNAKKRITGGLWSPVTKAFGMENIEKRRLSRLLSTNGNIYKLENPGVESKDFEDLKNEILPIRQVTLRVRREKEALNAIEEILNRAKGKEPGIVHDALERIGGILGENKDG